MLFSRQIWLRQDSDKNITAGQACTMPEEGNIQSLVGLWCSARKSRWTYASAPTEIGKRRNISTSTAPPAITPRNSPQEPATFPYLLQTIFRIHKSQLKEDKSGVTQAVWQKGYERARGREITQNYEVQSLDLPPMLEQDDCRPNYKRLRHSRVRTKNELWRLPVRRTSTTQA